MLLNEIRILHRKIYIKPYDKLEDFIKVSPTN